MPRRESPGPGVPVSSTFAGRFDELVDPVGGTTFTTEPLNVLGLPRLNFWLWQPVGQANSQVTLQFSVTSVAGPIPVLNWLPLAGSPFALVGLAVPVLVNFVQPVNFIRVIVGTPVFQATTVRIYPSASV